jgi:hypothetical protein
MELTGNPDNEEIVKLGISVLCLKTVLWSSTETSFGHSKLASD